jgi:hypothetical protein
MFHNVFLRSINSLLCDVRILAYISSKGITIKQYKVFKPGTFLFSHIKTKLLLFIAKEASGEGILLHTIITSMREK